MLKTFCNRRKRKSVRHFSRFKKCLTLSPVFHGRWLGILGGFVGLLAGYSLGIVAGVWIQRLGWMGLLVDFLAGGALIGMGVVGVVMIAMTRFF